jgi:hypothetical protein
MSKKWPPDMNPNTSLLGLIKMGCVIRFDTFNDCPYLRYSGVAHKILAHNKYGRNEYFRLNNAGLAGAIKFANGYTEQEQS